MWVEIATGTTSIGIVRPRGLSVKVLLGVLVALVLRRREPDRRQHKPQRRATWWEL
ncbi:hypothetical protein GCM10009557_23760 [Virgisporangium ochraceum]|uniref:Uncharacterized protein n=1 Tax=Virgisporangium ochraceum TaxID=65505 RepID=A0A8J4EBI3_9ACTN|nr:hypothetical protein Voc01_007790 [Virgisporangium ochraceum]